MTDENKKPAATSNQRIATNILGAFMVAGLVGITLLPAIAVVVESVSSPSAPSRNNPTTNCITQISSLL